MSDLTDFLLARIAEDEAEVDREDARQTEWMNAHIGASVAIEWFHPGRLRAECEARRRIVEEWGRVERLGTNGFGPGVLRHLASIYAEHADYREEWRP